MNEEIQSTISKIQKTIDTFDILKTKDGEWQNKINIARELCYQLTMLKLMIGINNFQNLHYFNLYDQEAIQFLISALNQPKTIDLRQNTKEVK